MEYIKTTKKKVSTGKKAYWKGSFFSHTVTTHHQQAHVKNAQRFFFSSKTKDDRKYCFAQSCDGSAYLRPGTSEGFQKTRNARILTQANEGAKQLPKYDWTERVYQTPASYWILNKEVDVNGQEKLISNGGKPFVLPKQFFKSCSTTWANETHRLQCEFPDSFEVSNNDVALPFAKKVCCFTTMVQGDVYFFTICQREILIHSQICLLVCLVNARKNACSILSKELRKLNQNLLWILVSWK